VLPNGAAMKSFIQKIVYTTHSASAVLIGCCGIFLYPSVKWSKSCAQSLRIFRKIQIL